MPKPDSIQQLELETGLVLQEVQPDVPENILLRRYKNCYMLDSLGRVSGLNICDNGSLQQLDLAGAWSASLEVINLSGCANLRRVIFPEGGMQGLQKLDMHGCALDTISLPGDYPRLHQLNLHNNRIEQLVFPGSCPALDYVDVSGNGLSGQLVLPAGMQQVRYLYLSRNRIQKLEIPFPMPRLETLHLGNNALAEIPVGLPDSILTIHLNNNEIGDLEPLLPLLQRDITFIGKENPWERPPAETVEKGLADILNYFEERRREGEEKSLEAKLILIGEQRAGKTSLRTRLLRPGAELPAQEDRTKGLDIDIDPYTYTIASGETMRLNVFDFGGQDHYKPLHQFFYSRRSLYVLVTANGDDSNDFDFWFDTAQLFGDGSPVFVVNNLFGDVQSGFNKSKYSRFSSIIRDVMDTNLKSLKGWPEVKKRIEQIAETLPHVQEYIPKSWANVRRALEARRRENVISWQEFLRICAEPGNGGMNRERAQFCANYLHDIGMCLHYHDDDLLCRQVIVRNEWATDAVYRVIDDSEIKLRQGVFDWNDLRRIWSSVDYEHLRPELLALMKKFRLCYDLPGEKAFVAPGLLPLQPPAEYAWKPGGDVQVYVAFSFMPPGLMSQLIVQLHPFIAGGKRLVWRDGVVLEWPDTRAEVSVFKRSGRQTFSFRVQGASRRDLLTYIDQQLDVLCRPFGASLEIVKEIPCNCTQCSQLEIPHFYDLARVEKRRKDGRRDIECDISYEMVPIEQLLGNVFSVEKSIEQEKQLLREQSPVESVKLFVSYSHNDEAFKDAFKKAVFAYCRHGKLEIWDDRQLLAGVRFEEEIFSQLRAAHIVCLLVSPDFIASDYCFTKEMEAALKRLEAGETAVVPVVIRPTPGWNTFPVGQLTAGNTDARPVSRPDNDEAWLDIANHIFRLVDEIRSKNE